MKEMTKFYFIRHGKPDYSYGDNNGFIGQGHDFAPLKKEKIKDVYVTSKDSRLKDAEIILTSTYTRALQTASIISRELNLDIIVEPDLREWQPDLTYMYKNNKEMLKYAKEYKLYNGEYPDNKKMNWETKSMLSNRVMQIINKYKKEYKNIIVVGHKIAFQSICECGDMEPAEIFEIDFE